jgi:hypothetical protein
VIGLIPGSRMPAKPVLWPGLARALAALAVHRILPDSGDKKKSARGNNLPREAICRGEAQLD